MQPVYNDEIGPHIHLWGYWFAEFGPFIFNLNDLFWPQIVLHHPFNVIFRCNPSMDDPQFQWNGLRYMYQVSSLSSSTPFFSASAHQHQKFIEGKKKSEDVNNFFIFWCTSLQQKYGNKQLFHLPFSARVCPFLSFFLYIYLFTKEKNE